MKNKRIYSILLLGFISIFTSLFSKESFGFRQLKTLKYTPGTQVLYYEHVKSGARLVWLKNNDTNRAFNIAFQTRSYDDVGLPHIFEHCCLAGSPKYPSSNLTFQMGVQTYNTFQNALTYQLFTCYPIASLSEEQLFASLDVYMNGIFDPIVLTEENDLKREAVRFVLDSPDGQITATGAVYNELTGVMANKNTVNFYNLRKLLYPNSTESFITGGRPEDILNVTWQSVKDYHEEYYKASNMVIYLYGKLNVNRFLKYFDEEFLSKYERTEVDLSDKYYEEWEGFREQTAEFPVTKDTNTNNASIFSYAFALKDISPDNFNDLRVINNYIGQESSWLSRTLKEHFPDANFSCYFNNLCRRPYYTFEVHNINEDDKDELKKIFEEAVNQLCTEKIDKKYIKIFANNFKLDTILDEENPDGITDLRSAGILWAISDDPVNFITYRKNLLKLSKTSTPETVLATARKYLLNPQQSVVLVTKPVAGLAEKKAEENAKYFADKKESMTPKNVADLVAENKRYNEWASENEKINLIDKVKVVSAQNLPEEDEDVEITDTKEHGFRALIGEKPGLQYVSGSLLFSLNTLPPEYLHPVMFYFELLKNLPTEKHSLEELEAREMIYTYSSSFYTSSYMLKDKYESGGSAVYATSDFMCLNENLTDTLDLVHELITETSLEDYDTIKSSAGQFAKAKRQGNMNNPANLAYELAFTAAHPAYTSRYYAVRYNYWDFLEKVSKMDTEELDGLVAKIREGLKIVFNRQNLTVTCVGDKKQIEKYLKYERAFAETLGQDELKEVNPFAQHEPFPKNIAVIIPGNSNYCFSSISLDSLTEKLDAKYKVISSFLEYFYLYTQIRFKYGAYGASSQINDNGLTLYSYRDPELKNTFRIFDEAADYLKTTYVTQKDLEGYITSIYSGLQEPISDAAALSNKISSYLTNDFEDGKVLRMMKQVKSVKPEDIKEFAGYLELLKKNGVRVVAGSAEQIYANKDMFDLIITEFMK
ncbi:insulinase family protein [Treponema sp. C6A8]|uniref:insulinase family protein n=1 Tax=Treponema sp. C6A8 TaxID=1410609 RepID=UPI000489CD5F|nr:insulinase family protein [Treponema sp. C6A8]